MWKRNGKKGYQHGRICDNDIPMITLLTYGSAVQQHLLQVASVVVERQVPGAGVHVLYEARFLEAAQQQAFGSFGSQDGISQRPGQRLPVQQLHKVELEHNTHTTQSDSWNWSKMGNHQTCINATEMCKPNVVQ